MVKDQRAEKKAELNMQPKPKPDQTADSYLHVHRLAKTSRSLFQAISAGGRGADQGDEGGGSVVGENQ